MNKDEALRPVSVLNEYWQRSGEIWRGYGSEPLKDSQAFAEISSFQRPVSIRTAFSQGDLFIEACADYVMALIKTLTKLLETIAPWACARGAVESAAFSVWLFDINVNARQRVKRSLALRYEGLQEQIKLLNATGKKQDAQKSLESVEAIEHIAAELGFVRIIDHRGKRVGVGQKMPSKTEIISDMLDKGANYRMLSAMTHAEYWALQQLSFALVEDEGLSSKETDIHYLEKYMEPSSITYLCIEALTSLSHAELMKCRLFRWDPKPLIDLYKDAENRISNPK